MNFLDFLRAVLALAVTIGLIGLAGWAARKYAPGLLARLQARAGEKRRLEVVETLVLGPAQRLLLVRVGDAQRLILLGEGRELTPPAHAPEQALPHPPIEPAHALFAARRR
jgi:flagellar protein FliO/FliZ